MLENGRSRIGPDHFADPAAVPANASTLAYLNAAWDEADYAMDRTAEANSLAGQPDEKWQPGSAAMIAARLQAEVYHARIALEGGDSVRTAIAFSAVTFLWSRLRDRSDEIKALPHDPQQMQSAKGVAQAEEHLRAMVAAGDLPIAAEWIPGARRRFGLGPRPARRVWERVVADFPYLSSAKGKPKRRRAVKP